MELAKRKRKVSKKTKKSWRKNIDTKDIDSFLENFQLQERLGVPFVSRNNDDLFFVDSKPEETTRVAPTKKERRLALKTAEPRCLAALKPHTAVPDPIVRRNRVRTPEQRNNPLKKRAEESRKLAGNTKLKDRIALKNKDRATAERSARSKRGEFLTDVWNCKVDLLPEVDPQWLTSDTLRHTLSNKGMKKKRIPVSVQKKPSDVPAVGTPHPGTSYNPSYEDHQELLRQVAQKEMELMKEEAHLDRVTSKIFKKVSVAEREKTWLRESSEGLPLKADEKRKENQGQEEDENNVVKSVNPPVKNAKKTLVQRRKQKEQRKLALSLKHAKVEKKKVSDIYKLKALKNHLASKDEKVEFLRDMRRKMKERKATEPKTLSKVRFQPLEPDFKLGEELSGNLRNSDPSGNLLQDRFKSLQERSIIAPSTRVLKVNKARVKRFQKADHRMP